MNRVFREEKKYLISLPEALQACHRLAQVMHEDPHNGISGYPVRSLYFDTLDDRDFHEKAAGVELRRKLRLRCYDPAADFAMLEMKQKQGASQLKRSLRVTREDAQALTRGDYAPLLRYPESFAAECYALMHSRCYRPKTIVEYDRKAFIAKALGYGASNTTSPFADVNDGYVTALYEAGVFIGTKVGDLTYFYPNSSITRAEVATIVYRIYQLSSLDQKQKIYYKDYTLDVLEGVPTNTYNQSAFVKNGSIMTYNDTSVRTRVGIDVSQYQGDVDWNAVARTDVDFVIARVGGRGYTVGAIYDDTKFDEYADGAARAGLQVGAYFFSQAVSVAEAQEEAYHVLDKLRGHNITGPVVFDWEVIGKSEARTYGIETGVLCAAANAFCKIIKDAGYDPMIYITDYAGYVKYDLSEVMDYPLWYARYDVDAPSFYYEFAMWQYSSKGSVDGIKGNVDMDIWFIK